MKKSRRTRSRPARARAGAPSVPRDVRDELGARTQQKTFRVPAGERVVVRFLNARPGAAGINVTSGAPLVEDAVELAPMKAGALAVIDFDVDFQLGRERGRLQMAEAIDVQIESGRMIYRERVFPDARIQHLRYQFLCAERSASLVYCARGQHVVEPDRRGKCPRHR